MSIRRILIHTFFSLAAFVSLYLLLNPLYVQTAQGSAQALLLSEGFVPTDLTASYAQVPQFTLSKKIAQQYPKALYYPDIASLQAAQPNIHTWLLLGYGLPASLLAKADSNFIIDTKMLRAPTGLINASWPSTHKPQAAAMLSLQSSRTAATKAFLYQATGQADSLLLPAGDSLLRIPLAALPLLGRGNATLLYEGDSLFIPLQREDFAKVRTLLWESSPSTELRFLKNWLQEQGYPGAIRTSISRFQTQQERFNMPQTLALDMLSGQLLENFDVLIMDDAALLALSPAEQGLLLKQIHQKGLGLLLLVSAPFQLPAWRGVLPSLKELADTERRVVPQGKLASLPEGITLEASPLLIEGLRYPIWKDAQGQVLSGWQSYGQGRIGVQSIQNTFQYRLREKNEAYQRFWAQLLATLSPPTQRYWQAEWPLIPRQGQTFPLKVQAAEKPKYLLLKPEAQLVADTLYLENSRGLFEWQATYHAKQWGWHEVAVPEDTNKYYLYVFEEEAWPEYRAQEYFTHTQKYAAKQQNMAIKNTDLKRALPPVYAFIIFLFSTAILWLEPKLATPSK